MSEDSAYPTREEARRWIARALEQVEMQRKNDGLREKQKQRLINRQYKVCQKIEAIRHRLSYLEREAVSISLQLEDLR